MKARLISVLLVIALLVTVGIVAAQAAGTRRTLGAIDIKDGNAVCAIANEMVFPTSGSFTADCPACKCTQETWEPLPTTTTTWSATTSAHFYLPASVDYSNLQNVKYTLESGGKVCIHLNGQTLKSTSTVFYNDGGTGSQLYIMGDGIVQGPANQNTIHWNGGYMGLFGGTYGVDNATVDTITIPGTFTRRAFCFTGTTVKGTFSATGAGSIYVFGGNYGEIKHDVHNGSTGNQHTYEIAGTAVIEKLTIASGVSLKVGSFESGASITVNAEGPFTTAFESVEKMNAALPYFHAEEGFGIIANETTKKLECVVTEAEGELLDPMNEHFNDELSFVVDTTNANCPHCGEVVTWDELTAGETLVAGTHYYLKDDLTLTTAFASVAGDAVTIHLNGHDITCAKKTVLEISAGHKVNIMGNGKVSGGGTSDAATILNKGEELNLYGGTYTHKGAKPTLLTQRATGHTYLYQAQFVGTEGATGSHIQVKYGHATMHGGSIAGGDVAVTGGLAGTTKVQHSFTMTGGTIDGGLTLYSENWSGQNVTISGTAKITKTNGGLTTDGRTITFGELADTAQVYVTAPHRVKIAESVATPGDIGTKVLAAEEFASIKYYHEEVIISGVADYGAMAAEITDFTTTSCPVCGDGVTWEVPTGALVSGGHYYIPADMTLETALAVTEGTVCVHLNGKAITAADGAMVANVSKGATLNVMGSGTVIGKGQANASVLYTKGTLNLCGGTYSHEGTSLDSLVIDGGTACMSDGVTFTSTRVTDENGNATDGTVYGRHVALKTSASTFNMFGGIIENGTVVKNGDGSYQGGGNIYVTNGKLNVTGGIIRNGHANISGTHGGGNIALLRGTLKLYNATVSNGKAVGGQGGNILSVMAGIDISRATIENGRAADGGNLIMRNPQAMGYNGESNRIHNTTITGGVATADGGNVTYMGTTHDDKPILKILGGKFTNGKAGLKGGNLYISPSSACEVYILDNAEFSGGEAYDGGNIYVSGKGTVQLISGVIKTGTAVHGALLYQGGGYLNVHSGSYDSTGCTVTDSNGGRGFYLRDGELTLAGGTFISNSTVDVGQAVYVGQATVDGYSSKPKLIFNELESCHSSWHSTLNITDEAANKAIALNNAACALEVDASWKHDVKIYFKSANNVDNTNHVVLGTATGEGNWTGSVAVGSIDGEPTILRDGATLLVANAKDGETWTSAQDMVDQGKAVTLLGNAELNLDNQTANVDLNGNNITVKGTGTFNGVNSNSAKAAEATLDEDVTAVIADDFEEFNTGFNVSPWQTESGKIGGFYNIVIEGDGTVSYHKLEMAITSISLRPSVAGLYYTSNVVADDTLKYYIGTTGILLGVTGEGESNLTEIMMQAKGQSVEEIATNFTAFTAIAPDELKWSGITSVLVKNILKNKEENPEEYLAWNKDCGVLPVVGKPFVEFKFGEDYKVLPAEDFKAYSMKGYLIAAQNAFANDKLSAANAEKLDTFCNDHGVYDDPDTWGIPKAGWTKE